MRRFSTRTLVPVLGALLAVTGFVACGGDDDNASRHQAPRSSDTSASDTSTPAAPTTRATTSTTAEPVAATPAQPIDAPAAPAPAADPCDTALVHDAIAGSGAVAPGVTFEVTYLRCAEGYGWAGIMADFGDGATVFLKGSGDDFTVLDLGTAVCPTYTGMPESVATQLAPEGSHWQAECL